MQKKNLHANEEQSAGGRRGKLQHMFTLSSFGFSDCSPPDSIGNFICSKLSTAKKSNFSIKCLKICKIIATHPVVGCLYLCHVVE